jgi:hypothetical protein
MNNKLPIAYFILIIVTFFFGCRGPVKDENKNNASASSLSLHVGNEKYFIIDTKESVVAWTGSSVKGKHEGYAYISKGELMIENGQLMGGTVEIDMNKIEGPDHGSDHDQVNIGDLLNKGLDNLLKLDYVYETGGIEKKREVISSMYPEKLSFDGFSLRLTASMKRCA